MIPSKVFLLKQKIGGFMATLSNVQGYCVKCKAKQTMVEAQQVTMKNGRPAVKGKCPKCSTGMYKILSPKDK